MGERGVSRVLDGLKYKHISVLLVVLSILNLMDAFITYYGLENGYIEEYNVIMNYLYSINIFLEIKVIFSLCMLFIVVLLSKDKKEKISNVLKVLVLVSNLVYLIVIGMHIYWLSYIFTFVFI